MNNPMMKLTQLFLFTVALSFAAAGAQAASSSSRTSSGSGSSSELSFGAGVSSIAPIPGGGTSVSGLLNFTPLDSVQILLSMPGVQGTFKFGVEGLYKRVILGDTASGFHVGGGLGLGTTGTFAMGIVALGGIHHNLSSHIALAFDGGATFGITSVAATAPATGSSSQADFGIGSLSSILGASIHYLF
jgi:hypothetical protein